MSRGCTALQQDIHDSFKEHVRRRRAGKIDAADESLFSGEVLTGRMALARGLIDGIGDLRSVMRARFGDKVRLVPIAHQRRRRWWLPLLRRRCAGRRARSRQSLGELLDWLEARALWARFGPVAALTALALPAPHKPPGDVRSRFAKLVC